MVMAPQRFTMKSECGVFLRPTLVHFINPLYDPFLPVIGPSNKDLKMV